MKWFSSSMCLILVLLAGQVLAVEAPARIKVLVPENHLTYDGLMGGTPGGYCYRASDDRFYTSTYGANLGIRAYISPDQEIPLIDRMVNPGCVPVNLIFYVWPILWILLADSPIPIWGSAVHPVV